MDGTKSNADQMTPYEDTGFDDEEDRNKTGFKKISEGNFYGSVSARSGSVHGGSPFKSKAA